MLKTPGTVLTTEFERDDYLSHNTLYFPVEATIVAVHFRDEKKTYPVYQTADLRMNNGADMLNIPFAYPTPDERRTARIGDRVLVMFREGRAFGAIITHFLDTIETSNMSRSLPDQYYRQREDGSKTRVDGAGNTVIQQTASLVDMGVDMASLKYIAFATAELKTQYLEQLDLRVYPLVNMLVHFQLDLGYTGDLITITHVLRTWAKQDEIYGTDPQYRAEPRISYHMYLPGCAVDGLVKMKRQEEMDACRKAIGRQFILFHSVVGPLHAHLQMTPGPNNVRTPGRSMYLP